MTVVTTSQQLKIEERFCKRCSHWADTHDGILGCRVHYAAWESYLHDSDGPKEWTKVRNAHTCTGFEEAN